jgi:O-succinylbenzoate synthase
MGDGVGDVVRLAVPDDISSIELSRVRLPLIEPFVATHGTVTDRDVVLVCVRAGDHQGWGECSTLTDPTYVDEDTDRAWSVLRDDLAPAVLAGRGATVDIDLGRRRAAAAALEAALLDLTGAWHDTWPAAVRTRVPSTAVIGRRSSVDAVMMAVASAVDQGYPMIKLKIGPGWDLEPLVAVRSAWPTLALAADANGSYPTHDPGSVGRLDAIGLIYLEQPMAPGPWSSMAGTRRRIDTPVALDESIVALADLHHAIAAGAVDVVNVKAARLGGVSVAIEAATVAAEAGVASFVGGMLETGVGRSVALRLAAGALFTLPTDLGPSARYFHDDLTEPIGWAAPGELEVPAGPGLARPPRADRLAEVTVDTARFS